MINGRVNHCETQFTCYKNTGYSVFDYICCDHATLNSCINFEVICPVDITTLCGPSYKLNLLSDHSILNECFSSRNFKLPKNKNY